MRQISIGRQHLLMKDRSCIRFTCDHQPKDSPIVQSKLTFSQQRFLAIKRWTWLFRQEEAVCRTIKECCAGSPVLILFPSMVTYHSPTATNPHIIRTHEKFKSDRFSHTQQQSDSSPCLIIPYIARMACNNIARLLLVKRPFFRRFIH